jgi:multicomponent Na+:H+ antiporter subunit D
MPSPFVFIAAPLVLSVVVYFVRRWTKVAGITGAILLLVLTLVLTSIDLGPESQSEVSGLIRGDMWLILGREVALTAAIRTILLFLYGALIVIFLVSTVLPQGTSFIPLSLAVLSPLAGALMVRPLVFGAVLLLIAAGILTIMIQGNRAGSTLAAFRYLTMVAIAVPLLLIAGWIQETGQTPLVGALLILYAVAFAILLIGFPFQIWVAPLIGESKALVPAVVIGLAQVVMIAFCLTLLLDSPSIQASAQFWRTIRISGALVLVVATLFCLTSRSFGRLLGYLLLINIGIAVLSFSLLDRSTPELVMTQLIARVPGLIVAGMGYGFLRFQIGPTIGAIDITRSVQRLAWTAPVGLVLYVYGGMVLLGLPLTVGFPGHWMAIDLASTESFWMAALMVLSMAAGVGKLLHLITNSLSKDASTVVAEKTITTEMKAAAGLALAIAVILAFLSQPLVDLAERMIQLI